MSTNAMAKLYKSDNWLKYQATGTDQVRRGGNHDRPSVDQHRNVRETQVTPDGGRSLEPVGG